MGPGDGGRVKPVVKALVLAHIALILHWSLPLPAKSIADGKIPATSENVLRYPVDFALYGNDYARGASPTRYYLQSTGLWQYWDMFAPNPASLDYWYDAKVTYSDGSERIVPYPRMKTMSIAEKFVSERYRKYIERTNNDAVDNWKWPVFAQRMALLATTDPTNLPAKVELRRHFRQLKGPAEPEPMQYERFTFYVHVVAQDDLRKTLGP
ncbi:MAG: hypothetical protein AB7F50_09275 [Fimbriimonadaceae bacterium]